MKTNFRARDLMKSGQFLKSKQVFFTIEALDVGNETFLQQALLHMIHTEDGSVAPLSVLQEPRVRQYIDNWERYPGHGFIAVEKRSGQPIGAVWIRYFEETEPGYGFVGGGIPELSWVVMPDHRGKGVGTALLQGLLESLPVDLQALSLSVSKSNPAKRLYERFGFKPVLSNLEVDEQVEKDSLIMLLDQEGIRAACSETQGKKEQNKKKGTLIAAVLMPF